MQKISIFLIRTFTGICLIALIATLYLYLPEKLTGLFWACLVYTLLIELPALTAFCPSYLGKLFIILNFTVPFAVLAFLNESPQRILLALLMASVFTFDSTAYLCGTLYGKHPLAPRISPKKTWEGFFGGLVCTVSMGTGLAWLLTGVFTWWSIPLFTLCALLACMGDLIESWYKRRAHLKDSGSILPGHGGILDRFDSFTLVSTLVYLTRKQLMLLLGF